MPRAPGVLPHLELQPYVVEAANLCVGGGNPNPTMPRAPGVLPHLELRRSEEVAAERRHVLAVRRRRRRRLEVRAASPG